MNLTVSSPDGVPTRILVPHGDVSVIDGDATVGTDESGRTAITARSGSVVLHLT